MKKIGLLVAVVFMATGVQQAGAEESSASTEASTEKDKGLKVSGTVSLSNSFGVGTFYRPDTALYAPSLSFSVGTNVPGIKKLSVRAGISMDLYALSSLDASTSIDPNEKVRLSDLSIDINHGELFRDEAITGILLRGQVRFYIPTSPGSRLATLMGAVGPRLELSRKFGLMRLAVGSRARFNFHRYDNKVLTPVEGSEAAIQGCVPRFALTSQAADRADVFACGGTQNQWLRLYHSGSVSFQLTKNLSTSVSLSVINSFAYQRPVDEFSSEVTRRTNNENQSDLTWGSVDISYDVNDHLSFSVGASSLQGAWTSDTQRLRFPWWDLEGPQANRTSIYADIAGSF